MSTKPSPLMTAWNHPIQVADGKLQNCVSAVAYDSGFAAASAPTVSGSVSVADDATTLLRVWDLESAADSEVRGKELLAVVISADRDLKVGYAHSGGTIVGGKTVHSGSEFTWYPRGNPNLYVICIEEGETATVEYEAPFMVKE